jgi:hypothetical protein
MVRDRLQSWLQIASNVGLLVGLVLVAVQIKQASDLTRYTLMVSSYQQETDHFDALMGENPAAVVARAKIEPEALTPADVEVLVAHSEWLFSMMRRNGHLEESGMFDSSWRVLLPIIGAELASNPVTRKYLLEYGDAISQAAGQDWLKVMQDAARATPPDGGKRFIGDMLRAANAGGLPAGSSEAAARAQQQ